MFEIYLKKIEKKDTRDTLDWRVQPEKFKMLSTWFYSFNFYILVKGDKKSLIKHIRSMIILPSSIHLFLNFHLFQELPTFFELLLVFICFNTIALNQSLTKSSFVWNNQSIILTPSLKNHSIQSFDSGRKSIIDTA